MEEGSQKNDLKGEKENDKLLTQADQGQSQSRHYGNVVDKSSLEAKNSLDRSSLGSSLINRSPSQKTSKDTYLQSLAEEEAPKATCKKEALKVFVTCLFVIIVVGVVVIWSFHEGRAKKHIGNQYFDFIEKKRVLNIYNEKDDIILSGVIRTNLGESDKLKNCIDEQTGNDLCYIFEDGAIFKFNPYTLQNYSSIHCADLMWENVQDTFPEDCFDIEYSYWYGLPNLEGQFWPLVPEKLSLNSLSYMPYSDEKLGHILENFWLSSSGTAVLANDPQVPITVSFNSGNNKKLCISVDQSFMPGWRQGTFNYSVCVGPNIKETFMAVRNYFFPPAPIINSESYDFENIVWQYENKYSNNIQLSDTFGDFLHKLNTIGLPIRMVQYNGEWEDSAGDFKFNTMTRNMLSHYFQGKYSTSRLLLPVNLACSYLSENFKEGASKRLFVRDIHTGALKTILYQGESCALWDSTNPATQTFLQEALGILQQSGTQEQTLYPQGFDFRTIINNKAFPVALYRNTSNVNAINEHFIDFLLRLNKTFLVETAYHMQNTSVFAEIPTLVSNIDGKKCLDYIIPAALTAGLHGYPYIVTVAPSEDQVDHELYLRWLQIAVFFPGLKVTNSVFNFHEITAKMLKYLSDYRENEILPIILDKFDDIESGMPLLRPLWWVNPSDLVSFKIDSEFLLGNKTLVAPVLCHGERARDIYLPSGTWRYNQTGHLYTGQQWLHNFEVPLSNIAVFTLQSEPDLNETTKHQ
ncbi:myogenesis-regulating glycosidase-like [Mya arenaria]|uniref:myogenesis-regulating glycosidase-like n=1 Tax=Mya arenaria TaxID=6604 RepID=UPI0022E89756|nr:myogenesis-regulating glycosidase-like [Mya arenaria]